MSEELKAIKRLKKMTIDYSLNSEDLHYAIVLYHLIINLQKENEELKEELKNASSNYTKYIQERDLKINKAIEFIKERTEYNQYSEVYPSVLDSREVKNILKILRGE